MEFDTQLVTKKEVYLSIVLCILFLQFSLALILAIIIKFLKVNNLKSLTNRSTLSPKQETYLGECLLKNL